MANTQELISDAADLAGAKAVGSTLAGELLERYLKMLNRMLSSWRDQGIDLGVYDLGIDDEVYIEDAEELCAVYNLATMIYELEGRPVNAAVYNRAGELFSAMQDKYLAPQEMEIPRELRKPRGFNITHG